MRLLQRFLLASSEVWIELSIYLLYCTNGQDSTMARLIHVTDNALKEDHGTP